MLGKAFEFAGQVITLLRDVREAREKINVLQNELEETNKNLRELSYQFQLLSQREEAERAKLTLQLENFLLKSERKLSAPKRKRKR